MEYVIKSVSVTQNDTKLTFEHVFSFLFFKTSNMKCDVKFGCEGHNKYLSVTKSKYVEQFLKITLIRT